MATKKQLWELETRTSDGSGNNVDNPTWGQVGSPLLRTDTPALYSDGSQAPRIYPQELGEGLKVEDPNSPYVSVGFDPNGMVELIDTLVRTEEVVPNSYGTSELVAFYGQFITHDMSASAIPVGGVNAPLFPGGFNDPTSDLFVSRTPSVQINGVNEQPNGVSHLLDASLIYGSSDLVAGWLRAAEDPNDAAAGAKLIEGANSGLPTFAEVLAVHADANAGALGAFGGPTSLVSGDVRVAQQPFLAGIQAVWLKEHNSQVDQLAAKYPDLTTTELFNTARIIVEAEHQHVIYDEYLGAIIGKDNVPQFSGYDPTVNPGIENVFTTVAFRFGHDQQSETVALVDADGVVVDSLDLATAFLSTTTQLQKAGGLEEVMRGLVVQKSQEVDGKLAPSLIDNVLGIPGLNLNLGLLDNIRAADHGIGTLNQIREQLGLTKYASFAELTDDVGLQQQLEFYYGHIDNVDPWLGGLLEEHVPGSQLGETFQAIVIAQFEASMTGDRFHYEERLKDFPELLADIKGTTFAEITMRNTDVDHLHGDAFHVAKEIAGTNASDRLNGADDDAFLDADNIIGGLGNDKIDGKLGNDTLWGDAGNDWLNAGDGDDYVYGGDGNDQAYGGKGDDNMKGGAGNDRLDLGDGNDWANGEAGNDDIDGGKGDDIALGKEGDDCISGGLGKDQLFGGDGKDTVSGDGGNDVCYGGKGDDIVLGGFGDDKVCGEEGNDTLSGGFGNDIFIFGEASGKDKILDFNVYQDKIDLTGREIDYAGLTITTKGLVTTIDLGAGDDDSITLIGVRKAAFTADAFIFDNDAAVA